MSESHRGEQRKWPAVPGLAGVRGYRRAWWRGDLLAGITVAAFLVPQVMAYAQVAGVPPVAGLWAALPALVAYAVLGSSRSLSMGPESTTALMTAVAIGPLAAGNPARYAELAASLALLVGLLSVCAGLARLGFVADLLPRPQTLGQGHQLGDECAAVDRHAGHPAELASDHDQSHPCEVADQDRS